ncbi:MAG: GAF domain-containing protein [Chloroflexota bacterium]
MRFKSLRWLTVAIPLLFLIAVDILRHQVWPDLLHPWPGYLIVLAIVGVAAWGFSRTIFDAAERMEERILRQNKELQHIGETAQQQASQLRTLHEASLALSSELALETVLRRIVDLARDLTGARYGALAVVDDSGHIVRFLTAGLTEEQQACIGDPPIGRGLLGRIFLDDRPIRVERIADDPRSIGFPPGHPPMTTYLGVPIALHGRSYGNLYLTDKLGQAGPTPFTTEDESSVRLFAAQAAVAMENARLHGQVQGLAAAVERERIARELHDSLAQALGYVRLQAAHAREEVTRGHDEQVLQTLAQIGEVVGDAYAEVREAILGLRSGGSGGDRTLIDALTEYLARYQQQTGVGVDLEVSPSATATALAPVVEVQLMRIVQEALANVRKHARTAHAKLEIAIVTGTGGPRLQVRIADDGLGFDLTQSGGSGHYGLAIMRERAEGVGGEIEIVSSPGRGTHITVQMPLEATHTPVVEA